MRYTQAIATGRRHQRGLSLVEMMIALAIGAALIAGIFQIFTSNNAAFRTQQGVSRMQETARFSFHFLADELREAGYNGCAGNAKNTNVLNKTDDEANYMFDFSESVIGYEYDASQTYNTVIDNLDPAPKDDTDIVVIRRAGEDEVAAAEKQPSSNAANLKAEEETAFKKGDILTISDCQSSWTFQVTQVKNSNTTVVINTGNKTDPGNAEKVTQDDLGPDFSISKALNTIFYISEGSDGEPGLYKKVNKHDPLELVTGVEDMQIEYGMDTDIEFVDPTSSECNVDKPGGEGDGQVDEFRTANDINENQCEWAQVLGVRLALLIRSKSDQLMPDGQTYQFAGTEHTKNDGRLRHVMNTTLTLRNKTR